MQPMVLVDQNLQNWVIFGANVGFYIPAPWVAFGLSVHADGLVNCRVLNGKNLCVAASTS